MKRRLVVLASLVAVLGAGAGIASADTDGTGHLRRDPQQICILFKTDGGPLPPYICVNYAPGR